MSIQALLEKANKLIESNQATEAKAFISEPKKLQFNGAEEFQQLLSTLCKIGHVNEINSILPQFVKRKEIPMGYYLAMVELYIRDGKLKIAADMLNKISQESLKDHPIIYAYIGLIQADNYQFEASSTLLKKALEQGYEFSWVHYRLAYSLMMQGEMKDAWTHISEGKSLNRSPEHPIYNFDQFNGVIEACYDEFISNPYSYEATLEALKLDRPTSDLLRTGEREPDSIFWALTFIVFMRNQNVFKNMNERTEKRENHKIPKNIFFYCEDPSEYQKYRHNIETWKEKHPDYGLYLIHDDLAIDYIEKQFKKDMLTAYLLSSEKAKMNLFALACMYMHGGVFVHAKNSCVQSVDKIIHSNKSLVLFQDQLGFISNEVIMAEPKQQAVANILVHAVKNALRSLSDNEDGSIFTTGNGHLTMGTLLSILPKLQEMKQEFADWAIINTTMAQDYIWIQDE